jgi:hypothetical protein
MARTTDARGFADLRGLAPGEWTFSVRASGYIAETQTLTVRVGRGLQDIVLDLVRGATLAGEVRDHFGRRVAGARVSIGGISTTTDDNGTFKLTGVASGTLEAESDGAHAAMDLRLNPGDERLSLTLTLEE